MNLGEWRVAAVTRLVEAGIESPGLEADLLAAHALGRERSWVLAHPGALAPKRLESLLARRLRREPLAYILGWREFYGRRFAVRPGVLIPRQESETLVESALDGMGGNVLDIGTGSGCLAVTLKLERPNWFVAACDVSPTAVRVARENARSLGAIVIIKRGDLFEPFRGTKFGVVVCNPPYVDPLAPLMPEVGEWEPPEALFAEEGGLAMYRRLAQEAPEHMMGWGRLIVELGDGMSGPVRSIFEGQSWELESVRPDLSGAPRAAVFRLGG